MNNSEYKREREKIGETKAVSYMLGIEEKELEKREEGSEHYPINAEAEFAMRHLSQNEKISARLLLGYFVREIINSEENEYCVHTNETIIKELNHKVEYKSRILKNMSLLEVYEVISIVGGVEEERNSKELERGGNEISY